LLLREVLFQGLQAILEATVQSRLVSRPHTWFDFFSAKLGRFYGRPHRIGWFQAAPIATPFIQAFKSAEHMDCL
jgi:hypothetical protein